MFWEKFFKVIGLSKKFLQVRDNHVMRKATEDLILRSKFEKRFFVMCALSGLMATLGILLNDTAILIAAMVLAPLLNPILAASAGIMLAHKRLFLFAAKSFIGGSLAVICSTALFIALLNTAEHQIEIESFASKFSIGKNFELFILTAGVSGFAAVYSWLRPTGISNLVGVAIAVSLIPFISFFGIVLGQGKFEYLISSGILFTLNLAAIVLGAILAFSLLGFFASEKKINHKIDVIDKK